MTQATITCRTEVNSSSAYHADADILSSSMLKNALESPASYIQALLDCQKPSRAMDFGTLLHALVLEPSTVSSSVAIYPSKFTRTKDCLAFKEANAERFCMTMAEFIKAKSLADKVLMSKFRGREFYKFVEEGTTEQSIYYTDPTTGLECRTRPDLDHPEFLFDLKTTRFCDIEKFAHQANQLNYDLSAYMYTYSRYLIDCSQKGRENANIKPFVLVPVCTEAPHSVFFAPISASFLRNGMKKYQHALSIISSCAKVQTWPALGGEEVLEMNHWNQFTPPSMAQILANA